MLAAMISLTIASSAVAFAESEETMRLRLVIPPCTITRLHAKKPERLGTKLGPQWFVSPGDHIKCAGKGMVMFQRGSEERLVTDLIVPPASIGNPANRIAQLQTADDPANLARAIPAPGGTPGDSAAALQRHEAAQDQSWSSREERAVFSTPAAYAYQTSEPVAYGRKSRTADAPLASPSIGKPTESLLPEGVPPIIIIALVATLLISVVALRRK